jgi:hypothetical protein
MFIISTKSFDFLKATDAKDSTVKHQQKRSIMHCDELSDYKLRPKDTS